MTILGPSTRVPWGEGYNVSGSGVDDGEARADGHEAVVVELAPADAAPADPLAAMTSERDKLKDQLLRTAADFDNYRKRSRKDTDDASRRGREDTLRELLPVADNLERAIGAAANAQDIEGVVEGVRMVHKLFLDSLERIGVARVPSLGERFDPSVHEAIQQIPTDEHPPGTVVAELVPGYRMGEKLIRAAMVAVAKPKPAAD